MSRSSSHSHSIVNNTTYHDVIILGGGAAGLFCALTAAKRGRSVLVLEKANKAGKKILMSGGGKCNFTNYVVEPENYISQNPHFCKSALKQFTQWDFIAMVEKQGIAYEERKHSQLFCKNSAKDILHMLLNECNEFGVTIEVLADVQVVRDLEAKNLESNNLESNILKASNLKFSDDMNKTTMRYCVDYLQAGVKQTKSCHSLVVATGALSIPTLGGSGVGYEIATQFGLTLLDCRAGLVPFMFTDAMKPICERLSGVSLDVEVSCPDHTQAIRFRENLLFTHRGISGPVMLQISNYWQLGKSIEINLLPDDDAVELLITAKSQNAKNKLSTVLGQRLGKSLTKELERLWWSEESNKPIAEFSDKVLEQIGDNLNRWQLKPSTTEGYRTAEVTLGGVNTDGISSKTMEAKKQAGLYFIGEVVDVTGHLGGFNFQWAWSSGYTAGITV
ncbi:MAG: NAD(P)/FAD-dependent oxidoreductase [Cellvibrionaceae bacterium]